MKVVLDTNVILAAFATRGLCEAVMAVCLDRHKIILSEAILSEVDKHLRGKFKLPATAAQQILGFLRDHADLVAPADIPVGACRDPNDRLVLGTAASDAVDVLITGDDDLLSLGQFQGIAILSPRAFYDQLI